MRVWVIYSIYEIIEKGVARNSTLHSRKVVKSIEISILLEGHKRVLELVAPWGILESLSKSQDARIVRNARRR